MNLNYILKDDKGNVGQSIPLIQGESRIITCFLFNPDGSPFVYTPTMTNIALKIFSQINQSSIQKNYTDSPSKVTPITCSGGAVGIIGFQFTLTAADTALMAPNNAGLPMTAKFTDNASPGNIFEVDFIAAFNVTPTVVTT